VEEKKKEEEKKKVEEQKKVEEEKKVEEKKKVEEQKKVEEKKKEEEKKKVEEQKKVEEKKIEEKKKIEEQKKVEEKKKEEEKKKVEEQKKIEEQKKEEVKKVEEKKRAEEVKKVEEKKAEEAKKVEEKKNEMKKLEEKKIEEKKAEEKKSLKVEENNLEVKKPEETKRRVSIKKKEANVLVDKKPEEKPVENKIEDKSKLTLNPKEESPPKKTLETKAEPKPEEPKKKLSVKKKVEEKNVENLIEKKDEPIRKESLTVEEKRKESLTIEEPVKKKLSIKKAGKRESIPSIAIGDAETEKSPVDNPIAKRDSLDIRAPIPVVREPTPEIERKDSVDNSSDRRDSIVLELVSPRTSRRPSIIIIADEKGLAVDETGQTKKLRPGEMLEVRRGSRRGSIDMRSAVEVDRADKPSTPLRATGDEGPPVITDFVENVSAVDGKTAFLQATVESNPLATFKFYKDGTEIFEGGRFKIVTDGETNTIYFCIRKAQSKDEGKYKITAFNVHGEDSCNIKVFVSGEYTFVKGFIVFNLSFI
jgi:hypothetical protein